MFLSEISSVIYLVSSQIPINLSILSNLIRKGFESIKFLFEMS